MIGSQDAASLRAVKRCRTWAADITTCWVTSSPTERCPGTGALKTNSEAAGRLRASFEAAGGPAAAADALEALAGGGCG